MEADNEQITSSQLTLLLLNALTGVGVLVVPARTARFAGSAGWMSSLLSGLCLMFVIWLMVRLCRRNPDLTVVEIASSLLGKPLGLLAACFLFLLWLANTSLTLRTFGEINRDYLLPRTPIEIVIMGTLLASCFLARKGIEPLARLCVLVYPVSITLGIGAALLSLFEADVSNLLPFWGKGVKSIVQGSLNTSFAFCGGGVIMMLLPFLNKPEQAMKAALKAGGAITCLNLLVTVVCLTVFGPTITGNLLWPSMLVVRTIEMPGVFLERVDVFIYAVWLIQVFLLQSVMLYVLSLTVSRIMKIGEYKIFVWPLVPCVFFLSLFPLNIAQLSVFNTVTPVILASYVFILALALNLLSRGKGGNVRV